MRWTSREIGYLTEHAHEGAASVAEHLGRTVYSVQWQASQYGISLRRRWFCPSCGHWVFKPLNGRTGWCAACTKELRRTQIAEEIAEMRAECARDAEQDRKRQALYSMKNRVKSSKNAQ